MVRKGFVLLALVSALVAAGSTFLYLNGLNQKDAIQQKSLVVAKSEIAARSVLTAEQLTLKEVPLRGFPQGGVSSIQDLLGSVALINLKPGDPVLLSMTEKSGKSGDKEKAVSQGSSSSLAIPEGKRAVAVPIGLVSGVAYAVKPGDHVDVLVTIEIKDTNKTITSLAAQDVLVLSVGESATEGKDKIEAKSYTLALSVPQAMAITLGSEKGSIRLLLRNPANTEQRQDTPIEQSVFVNADYHNIIK